MTPTYIATLQFIVSTVTSVVKGKKEKTNIGHKNARAPRLTARPNFPSVQRWCGSDSPRIRLRSTQPIETMYAESSDVIVSDITALRATWDPMLIIERRIVTTSDTMTELRGMFQPGVT
jgi:hypothetical protein